MNETMPFVCLFIYPLAVFFFALGERNNVKRKKLLRQVGRFACYYLRLKVRSGRLNIGWQSSFLPRLWMETESMSIEKLQILYEFDVRLIFTPICGGRICHVLLTVQKTHRRPLLFIDNRHSIGFLYKQN